MKGKKNFDRTPAYKSLVQLLKPELLDICEASLKRHHTKSVDEMVEAECNFNLTVKASLEKIQRKLLPPIQ